MDIGTVIKERRALLGISQQDLSDYDKELIMINYRIPSLHICRYICYFAFHKT